MKLLSPTLLTVALAAAFPAAAQSNEALLKELQALKERVNELEKKLQAAPAEAPKPQWGMTPEQAAEFNRIANKTEALEDSREMLGFKNLKVSGYMDPAFIYNKAQNRMGAQFLNKVGDDGYNYDNSYFGTAVIDFQKETDSGVKWRLTLSPNRGVGSVFDGDSIVQEATVSIPLTDLQTRLIAGQLPDWSGYEYLPATQNKLITHNLLFDFTLPTAYTGIGMDVTSGKWITKFMVGNMNKTKKDAGVRQPMLAYRVDYAKGEFNGFGFAGVHGNAANFANCSDSGCQESRLDLFEVDGYFIRGDWTVQGQASFGRQRQAAIVPAADDSLRDAQWWGLSGLAAYKFTPRFEGIARLDYLSNAKNGGGLLGYTGYFSPADGIQGDYRNGIGVAGGIDCATDRSVAECNKGANRMALSMGLSYLFDASTTLKLEYRLDRANQAVFENVKDGSYSKTNHLLGASVVVAF